MAITEVDENELIQLRRMGAVASKIMANPKAKKLLEAAHKEVDPQAITPALDQERMIQEPVNAAVEEVRALKAELAAAQAERDRNEKLAGLQKTIDDGFAALRSQGWQEEGITKVREFMNERGIIDPIIAANTVEKSLPPQQPAAPSGVGAWNFIDSVQDGEADLKKLIDSKGEYEPLIDKMAREALTEIRGPSRR